ncbi:MAG: T9SS type A sorting domain-containing protein, partial [Ferruginibacter sp.]
MKPALVIAFIFMHVISHAAALTPNLTAVFDPEKKLIILKWQNNDPRVTGFLLQKSNNNYDWTDVYLVEADLLSEGKIQKYTDVHPDPSINYYKLKQVIDKDHVEYSPVITVRMGLTANSWIIYPVPATTFLKLQYTGSELISNAISVIILNAYGKILIRFRSSSLNRIISVPVSSLGKGIYDVRIVIMNKVVWNQQFVK